MQLTVDSEPLRLVADLNKIELQVDLVLRPNRLAEY